jgi:hypothetical protein
MRIPFLRKYARYLSELYPLSAPSRLGRKRGRPGLPVRMAPCSVSFSATDSSWRSPGVSKKVTGFPFPSQRMWIFVLNPPWLRPMASASGVLFFDRQHVDEPERYCHPQNEFPNPLHRVARPGSGFRRRFCPRYQLPSSGENGCRWWTTFRIARAYLAKALRCAEPRESRSQSFGVPEQVGPYGVSPVVKRVAAFPIVRLSSRLCS